MSDQAHSSFSPKNIALLAHDIKKDDLLAWTEFNIDKLAKHTLDATGTTGRLFFDKLDLNFHSLQSWPLGRNLPRL